MKILARGIETNSENYTRFLEIGYENPEPTGNDKTTIAFIVAHKPGTLVSVLSEFSSRGVNLSKIESRPRVGKPWEYIFFVELDGHITDAPLASAVEGLEEYTIYIKHLGSYPKAG
jgi:chorismate mutase/prephenate dehydratase